MLRRLLGLSTYPNRAIHILPVHLLSLDGYAAIHIGPSPRGRDDGREEDSWGQGQCSSMTAELSVFLMFQ